MSDTPRHSREYSAIRELNIPRQPGRHAEPDTRLGAADPAIAELMRCFAEVPVEIREMGRRDITAGVAL